MTLQELYNRAVRFQQMGNLAQSEKLYLEILSADPSSFAPRYMLGIICAQQNRNAEALILIGDALKVQPNSIIALVSYGNVLCALGRFREAVIIYNKVLAIKSDDVEALHNAGIALTELELFSEALAKFDKVLAINPSNVTALSNRGNALRGLNRFGEALASYDGALAIIPDRAETLSNRGVTLCDLKRFDEALVCYDKALAIKPADAEVLYNRGHALQDLTRFEEAVTDYDRALAIIPEKAEALYNRGVALLELKRFSEALASFDKTLAIKPDYVEAHYNRGLVLCDLKRPEEALASYDKALAIKPDFIDALENRGIPLQELRRLEEAIASFDRAITVSPDDAKSYWNKGLCKLLMGHFEEGWRLHEWRKKLPKHDAYRSYPQPLWSGAEDINGKTLYVYAEQGLGDTMQFCRYATVAEKRGANVILCVQSSLVRLINTLSPTIAIRALNIVPHNFDYHIPLLSMPLAFGTHQNSVPANVPYLHAEPDLVRKWKDRIGEVGIRVGICWQGSSLGKKLGKSFTVDLFEGLSKIPGVRLINLQKNAGTEQLADLPMGMKVELLGEDFDNGPDAFIDTAAVMENLDLVITTDTSIAHLAGALGKPTWIALKYVPDWRWLLDRSDSPWYPTTLLFRQQVDGDWSGPFAQMETLLVEAAKSPLHRSPAEA